jgi:hypothetical protein
MKDESGDWKRTGLAGMILLIISIGSFSCGSSPDELLITPPEHGFVSRLSASRWEESMITGNGTIGALVFGDPLNERVILSHEKLFMPEYPPAKAPPLYKYMDRIREMVLNGRGEEAAELAVEAGREAGIQDLIWTDPLVPACQMEIISLSEDSISNYARSVNYETGEATAAWESGDRVFRRTCFFSRPDSIGVLRISGSVPASLNVKFRLSQLPIPEEYDEDDEWNVDALISEAATGAEKNRLFYTTLFRKKWTNSIKGYRVDARIIASGGHVDSENGWVIVHEADEIMVLMDIRLSYSLPLEKAGRVERYTNARYPDLLDAHKRIHSEMFNRFSLTLGGRKNTIKTAEELIASSQHGALNPELVNRLCEASRYALISSTGELPPTLQGIWGGTWRPAWSGDFTLNGNVPSAIACGLNSNFQEVTEAYLNYMWSMVDDFRDNARDLYKAPGIFVPSRTSSSGKTYHYLVEYPHLFWYAGDAWTSQFFYDYWLYTGNEQFLVEKAIPFMLASADFYEFILMKDEDGKYIFLPSYSPEIGPVGYHPVAINAAMDVAALKQLLRNLLKLTEQGWLESGKSALWKDILEKLPDYAADENGDLKEWIWPGLENDNSHRHASHLYPLFYEVDPDFEERPELKKAAVQAIENRLQYRRERGGAEMAFGLVQKGLAAAHIRDTKHAYECVDWLCSAYWSVALTSYHDPGEIFNVDICGGLPAVVTEMILQSSDEVVELLPALPGQWPEGKIRGVRTRCGVTVDLEWKDNVPLRATLHAQRNTAITMKYKSREWPLELSKDQVYEWRMD